MKLTKSKIDEAQSVLEAIMIDTGSEEWLIVNRHKGVFYIDCDGIPGDEVEGSTLYDAYINALHAKAGTEPPPF